MKFKRLTIFSAIFCLFVTTPVLARDSADNRDDKEYFIYGTYFGGGLPYQLGSRLSLGLNADEDLSYGLEVSSASGTLSSFPTYSYSYSSSSYSYSSEDDYIASEDSPFTYTSKGLFLRYFIGNSFNILCGVSQRIWSVNAALGDNNDYSYYNISYDAKKATAEINVTAIKAGFAIGNEWTFDSGFIMGFDWIAYSQFIQQTDSYTLKSNSGMTVAEIESGLIKINDFIDKMDNMAVLIMYIGWAF